MAVKKTTRAQCVRKAGHSWVKGKVGVRAGHCRKTASRSRSRSRSRKVSRRSRSRSRSGSTSVRYIYVTRRSPTRTVYVAPRRSPSRTVYVAPRRSPSRTVYVAPRKTSPKRSPTPNYFRSGSPGSVNCNLFQSQSVCSSSGCTWSGGSCY